MDRLWTAMEHAPDPSALHDMLYIKTRRNKFKPSFRLNNAPSFHVPLCWRSRTQASRLNGLNNNSSRSPDFLSRQYQRSSIFFSHLSSILMHMIVASTYILLGLFAVSGALPTIPACSADSTPDTDVTMVDTQNKTPSLPDIHKVTAGPHPALQADIPRIVVTAPPTPEDMLEARMRAIAREIEKMGLVPNPPKGSRNNPDNRGTITKGGKAKKKKPVRR
ncbi:hypothetical protein EV360DRAFT_85504 [Lentinula raphanica]|nr:hypothetical protein EV360DRAFT_85504 [Lentinula raphanica]